MSDDDIIRNLKEAPARFHCRRLFLSARKSRPPVLSTDPLRDKMEADQRDLDREAHDAEHDRVAPATVIRERFEYWYLYAAPVPPAECGKVVGVCWRDNVSGEEQRFDPGDYLGQAKWKRRQVKARAA